MFDTELIRLFSTVLTTGFLEDILVLTCGFEHKSELYETHFADTAFTLRLPKRIKNQIYQTA